MHLIAIKKQVANYGSKLEQKSLAYHILAMLSASKELLKYVFPHHVNVGIMRAPFTLDYAECTHCGQSWNSAFVGA